MASLAVAGPGVATAKRRSCAKRGTETVVANRYARVFVAHRRGDSDQEYYGCVYGQRRDTFLADDYAPGPGTVRTGGFFQLAGRIAGFAQRDCGFDYCDFTARSVDLAKRRRLRKASGIDLYYLSITRSGSLALLNKPSYPWETTTYAVRKVEKSGSTLLDEGPDIDPGSLALGSHWVYWRRAGVARAAPIE